MTRQSPWPRVVVFLFLLAESAPAAEPFRLLPLVSRYGEPTVETESSSVEGLRVSVGHLSAVLTGFATPVRAGDEVVGFFFRGKGLLEYESVDPIEFPVMTYNLRKNSSLSAVRRGTSLGVGDTFTELLWIAAGVPLPPLTANNGTSLARSFQRHRVLSARVTGSPLAHRFALQRIDAPASRLVYATFFGGREDFLYLYDGVERQSETLALLRRSDSGSVEPQALRRTIVSDQPIGRDRRQPFPPRFLLTDVDFTLVASSGRDARLSVTETIAPQGSKQSVFRFDLFSTVVAPRGPGADTRFYRVRSVTDDSGRRVAWHHQNDELVVGLERPIDADGTATIRFEIEGDFLIRPEGDSYWMLGVEPWFPQPQVGGQFYTMHSVVRVPEPFVPFAPGVTLSRRSQGGENVLESRVEQPIQFAVVLAGRYAFEEETRGGVTIRVASYAMKNRRAIKQLTNLAFGIIDFYQRFLGPFPFAEFNILEINSYGFGQAPPGVMFITREAFNPIGGEDLGGFSLNQLFSQGINERFAHEIAHQYWGHVVKMSSQEEEWLTESFAEYCAALFLRTVKGPSAYRGLVRRWRSAASSATDAAPIPLAGRVSHRDPQTLFSIRTGLVYGKGALLLAELHGELGDQVFLTFLKSFQKSFRWKFGSTRDVAGLLQFLTKKDYTPFFEANFWGTGMPGKQSGRPRRPEELAVARAAGASGFRLVD